MKKIIPLVLVFVLILSITVFGAPAPKTVPVSISASAITVNVGETVDLTATTLKHGSGYTDVWTGASKNSTVLNADENYLSTATFSTNTPGTYSVNYNIIMSAGKSGVTFNGSQSITITVVVPVTIVGATVKNIVLTPLYNPQGKLNGFNAVGDIYAVWSNQTESYYGKTNTFHFSTTQFVRNIDVVVNGITYTVSVSR